MPARLDRLIRLGFHPSERAGYTRLEADCRMPAEKVAGLCNVEHINWNIEGTGGQILSGDPTAASMAVRMSFKLFPLPLPIFMMCGYPLWVAA